MLYKLLTETQELIHVHHIQWMNEEGRSHAEERAMSRIIPFCQKIRQFDYSASSLDLREVGLIGDYQVVAFMAVMLAKKYPGCARIALAWVSSDLPLRQARQIEMFERLRNDTGLNPDTHLYYPVIHLSKRELYDQCAKELMSYTWSCRTPVRKYERCGKCVTCLQMAREGL